MNITEITKVLHDKINDSSSPEEIFILSKVIESLNTGMVKTVPTYLDLLKIFPKNGEVCFVEDEERLYYAVGNIWFSMIQGTPVSIWSWGCNSNGRLGDNTIVDKSSPVSVTGEFNQWISTSSGNSHNISLRADGTLWSWGFNGFGRLGDGTTTQRSSPVSVVGGFNDWVSASAADYHSIGLREDGTLWAWGNNGSGRLGDNTTINRSSPVLVIGGFTDWVSASAGNQHTVAVRANGTLWAWGLNNFGQLGDNTTVTKSSPVSVVGGFTDWSNINAGFSHSTGVRANGTLWSWGYNNSGRLGDNTTINRSSPVIVVGEFTDWINSDSGGFHSLGVRANGTLWAWGSNGKGQLGDNSVEAKSSPVSVIGGFTDWISASAGNQHTVAVRANGTLWAWGENIIGQLGNGSIYDSISPVNVIGGFTDWISASAGRSHSLGLRAIM